MGGWGQFFGKVAEQFQGRVERLKNEKERLNNEQKKLMAMPPSDDVSRRIAANDDRLREITKILTNAAN